LRIISHVTVHGRRVASVDEFIDRWFGAIAWRLARAEQIFVDMVFIQETSTALLVRVPH